MEPGGKILVIDDEKRICHNVKKILSKNNFEVTQALTAQEALEKMATESYALLISDIVMPGMNGLELLKMVKNEWPLTKVIMMTAYASTDTAVKAIRLGALDYIPKPFTPKELRDIVRNEDDAAAFLLDWGLVGFLWATVAGSGIDEANVRSSRTTDSELPLLSNRAE